jgi:hypothetical protein
MPEPSYEPLDPEGFSAKPLSEGAKPPIKPPPIKATSGAENEQTPAKKSRYDDDDDEPMPPKNRRRYDDDDDDDDFDVRKRRRPRRRQPVNGVAIASMVVGIVSVVIGLPGVVPSCCCSFLALLSLVCGILAVTFAFMSKTSLGFDAFSLTGMICGFVGIGLSLIGILLTCIVFSIGFADGVNQGMNQQQMNRPIRR